MLLTLYRLRLISICVYRLRGYYYYFWCLRRCQAWSCGAERRFRCPGLFLPLFSFFLVEFVSLTVISNFVLPRCRSSYLWDSLHFIYCRRSYFWHFSNSFDRESLKFLPFLKIYNARSALDKRIYFCKSDTLTGKYKQLWSSLKVIRGACVTGMVSLVNGAGMWQLRQDLYRP